MERTVTETEIDISALGTIVSKTDVNGTILDVNEAFVEASGYSREELIGQPHNILRHPDVPQAVFKDFWQTIQSGKPWVQVVKNRTKDGHFYWVEASVIPRLKDGKIIGYLSVRRAIDDSRKRQAEQLYREIQQGRTTLRNGYQISPLQRIYLFNEIHPFNLMLTMIALLGIGATLIQADIVNIPVIWVAVISGLFFAYAWAGRKYAYIRLGQAKRLIDKMREGDFSGQVNTYGQHSLSKLVSAVKVMQVQLGEMYDDAHTRLNRSTRLKSALDSASSQIMMVDRRGNILYMNDALQSFFESHQTALRNAYPQFETSRLIGERIEVLFKEETRFKDLSKMQDFEAKFAEFIFNIKIRPVYSEQEGNQIGTVIEWLDLTQQKNIENTLKSTLQMASIGHTQLHLDNKNLEGFFLDTSNNINELFASLNEIIEDVVFVMNSLATGDVRGRIQKDLQGSLAAMKGATNVSLDNLSSIIWYIKQAAETVNHAAYESSKASQDLSTRTQQAAATLEEINATMQNVNQTQIENSQELAEVAKIAEEAVLENDKAKQALNSTVEAIEDIQTTSDKISAIIGLIDGIAFQTNLLALNAAVEAARAGEHGRGFAVVAGEVRSLAQKSADAAKEIKTLIDESSVKVNMGVSKVQETENAFTVVNEEVSRIGRSLAQVMDSIREQQHSVHEVSQAIQTLDANIQNNAALVEKTSEASDALKVQAELLSNETGKFQIDEAKTAMLIQSTPPVYGVRMADVRQKMRIWLTSVQSYLNGVNVTVDIDNAADASQCDVSQALQTLVSADASIKQLPEYERASELHQEQHALVKEVLALNVQMGNADFEQMKLRDQKMDRFVSVSMELDGALDDLNRVCVERGSGSYAMIQSAA
ncbi:methyl-accepting chemotaxis protein [Thiomicrorhabdus sp. zzn3]|uniref:methyl-accepting chemotaxis protein n=1 Tax=Thiomicrorhabdus sp. zzn3 TaxID=3039775 RepID=UPI00243740E3|nr:methyl-accepting chemotaxis protein [Thiomicrorhabdus sp. zzn3]MDG6778368.1 methyl-accepting chemotaxis protein [Thiomicrorhabdus sp. zzn3]